MSRAPRGRKRDPCVKKKQAQAGSQSPGCLEQRLRATSLGQHFLNLNVHLGHPALWPRSAFRYGEEPEALGSQVKPSGLAADHFLSCKSSALIPENPQKHSHD